MSLAIDSPTLQERLDELREEHDVPGASVAVLRDGDVRAAASGMLNLDTGVEATADSLFQIGSITKVWTATLVMQLVDEGLVELDAPGAPLPARVPRRRRGGVGVGHGPPSAHAHERDRRRPLRRHRPRRRRARGLRRELRRR